MDLQLHNSASGSKELFQPLDPDRITLYVCGPTVYDYVHIGNGRPAVVFDVLYRLLKRLYPNVVYARNITDIDDKINASAKANGEPIQALADRYTAAYIEDVDALGVLTPDIVPRATDHIQEIITIIEQLIAGEFAYEGDGHVLFNVPADPAYGSLARRSLEDMLDGARVDIAPYKRDAKDFVLWKPSSDDLPGWDSPWGRGRPGWHIECSAMIRKHLGLQIDIHGGGSDLLFPHHENEAAQSRCANQQPDYVRYWVHNGMLTMGQEKMSKSLGNIVTIRGLRERHPGEVLRYALLSGHYRSSLAWSDDLLHQAKQSLDTLYQALREGAGAQLGTAQQFIDAEVPDALLTALCDDLNTPQALAAMHANASAIHKSTDATEITRLQRQLLAGGWLLGLLNTPVEQYFQTGVSVDENFIQTRIDARNQARANRDFAAADTIRDELLAVGIELEDTREGTRWKTISE